MEPVAMVDFLYFGEANVDQESLELFLGLAEELKLKGLTGSSSGGKEFRDKEVALLLLRILKKGNLLSKQIPLLQSLQSLWMSLQV